MSDYDYDIRAKITYALSRGRDGMCQLVVATRKRAQGNIHPGGGQGGDMSDCVI